MHCWQHQELTPPLCARAVAQSLSMRWALVQYYVTAWIGMMQRLLLLRWSLTYSIAGQVERPDVYMQAKHWYFCRLTGGWCLQMDREAVHSCSVVPPHEHLRHTCRTGIQHSMLPGDAVCFLGRQP